MNRLNKKPALQGKIFLLILALALVIVPIFCRTFIQTVFILVAMYAYFAACWNIICGFSGNLSLGHGMYVGIGAYVTAMLYQQFGISPWISMFIGGALAAVLGMVVGLPTFKLSGPYFTLSSIALMQMLGVFVRNTEKLGIFELKGGSGISLTYTNKGAAMFEFTGKLPFYFIILAMLAIVLLITYLISRNKLGYYLVAIRSDQDAARSLGINLTKPRLIAMAISCFLMGIGGAFYVMYFRYIGPDTVFMDDMSTQIALIALVGGSGTVLGPLLGGVVVIPISELLAAQFSGKIAGLNLLMYGIALMLVVFFMPKGINEPILNFFDRLEGKLFFGAKSKKSSKK